MFFKFIFKLICYWVLRVLILLVRVFFIRYRLYKYLVSFFGLSLIVYLINRSFQSDENLFINLLICFYVRDLPDNPQFWSLLGELMDMACLACCDSWGRKESDTTERLIWSDLIWWTWHVIVLMAKTGNSKRYKTTSAKRKARRIHSRGNQVLSIREAS